MEWKQKLKSRQWKQELKEVASGFGGEEGGKGLFYLGFPLLQKNAFFYGFYPLLMRWLVPLSPTNLTHHH